MEQELSIHNIMKSYIDLAKTGHYPLFFEEWMNGNVVKGRPLTYRSANRTVRDTFKKLSRHRTTERKKTALISLDPKERNKFIQSFFKVVEHNILKDLKTLH